MANDRTAAGWSRDACTAITGWVDHARRRDCVCKKIRSALLAYGVQERARGRRRALAPLTKALDAVEEHHGCNSPWRKVAELPIGGSSYYFYVASDGDLPPMADDISGPMADFIVLAYALARDAKAGG